MDPCSPDGSVQTAYITHIHPTSAHTGLRRIADRAGALLVLDEIRTNFRVGSGLGSSWIETAGRRNAPDLYCLCKVIRHYSLRGVGGWSQTLDRGLSPSLSPAPAPAEPKPISYLPQLQLSPKPQTDLTPDTGGLDPIGLDPIGLDPIGQDPIGQDPIGQDPIGLDPIVLDPIGRP